MGELVDMESRQARIRADRRGCILRLLAIWFTIFLVVVGVMIFVRSRSNRDPEAVAARVDQLIACELPAGFRPYSRNHFLGVELLVFWNDDHAREDGRTTSVLAIYREDDWRGKSVEEVAGSVMEKLENKLDRNEFRVKEREEHHRRVAGQPVLIYVLRGIHKIEDKFENATTCYSFWQGPEGPLQIHSMGLDQSFDAEAQLSFFSTVRPRSAPPGEQNGEGPRRP